MKVEEATIYFRCAYCDEELAVDIGDVFDFNILEQRVRSEFTHNGWKLFGADEIPFCSNQHLLQAREEL